MLLNVKWSNIIPLRLVNLTPQVPGIYIIWVNKGYWKPIYVGKAQDLRQRLKDHLSQFEQNSALKKMLSTYPCWVTWAYVNSELQRSGIERYLYDKLSPMCNQVSPNGIPQMVNLPLQINPLSVLLSKVQRR